MMGLVMLALLAAAPIHTETWTLWAHGTDHSGAEDRQRVQGAATEAECWAIFDRLQLTDVDADVVRTSSRATRPPHITETAPSTWSSSCACQSRRGSKQRGRRPPLAPWLRINRLLRVMLQTRWSAEAWSQVRVEFQEGARAAERDPARGVVRLAHN
jgi:hypothetical protein